MITYAVSGIVHSNVLKWERLVSCKTVDGPFSPNKDMTGKCVTNAGHGACFGHSVPMQQEHLCAGLECMKVMVCYSCDVSV